MLTDREVAGCLRGLIGCFLVSGGSKGALKLLLWCNLELPLTKNAESIKSWPPSPPPCNIASDSIAAEEQIVNYNEQLRNWIHF